MGSLASDLVTVNRAPPWRVVEFLLDTKTAIR
jgi:hypothetical protein